MTTTTTPDLLTRDEVLALLKCARSTLYAWMEGDGPYPPFPKPIKLGAMSNRWVREEVEEWIRQQPRAR